jgi:NifU-like protein involved in Fe-S cluster formation
MSALPPALEVHFRQPRNAAPAAPGASLGRSENLACGDWLELALECTEGRVERATFQARGCSATIACASLVTSALAGLALDRAREFDVAAAVAQAGGLPPTARHAAELVARALGAALSAARGAALAQPDPRGHSLLPRIPTRPA